MSFDGRHVSPTVERFKHRRWSRGNATHPTAAALALISQLGYRGRETICGHCLSFYVVIKVKSPAYRAPRRVNRGNLLCTYILFFFFFFIFRLSNGKSVCARVNNADTLLYGYHPRAVRLPRFLKKGPAASCKTKCRLDLRISPASSLIDLIFLLRSPILRHSFRTLATGLLDAAMIPVRDTPSITKTKI